MLEDPCIHMSHVCEKTKNDEDDETEELRKWALECNVQHSTLDKLLLILRKRLLPNLPKSSKTFLNTKNNYKISKILNEKQEPVGEFVYFGIEEGLRLCVNTNLHPNREIKLQFNVDGLPLFNSSKKQFWPILCKVFSKIDVYKPFAVAIFCGNSKPTNVNSFLTEFVADINKIMNNDFIIDNEPFSITLHSFICDTPARSFLKMTKGHGGFSACERCTVYGSRCENRTVYCSSNALFRTDESFRNYDDVEHHIGHTPLVNIEPKINLISHFVLDSMHLCSGVTKKIIEYWILCSGKARISRVKRLELSRRMLSLRNAIPYEFQRKPRSTDDVKMWKATEFRFFLLYCGPIVLKNVLD
ncbi:PREDICTED: uncharacterized protein LOC105559276, partial [Vollenhovia emeryi]|uniref:uncharacterized protein LOC105559276 n=1 Tax=Vollenhovia emeryi TaxID=411798 RepID=UPI0005F49BB1